MLFEQILLFFEEATLLLAESFQRFEQGICLFEYLLLVAERPEFTSLGDERRPVEPKQV